MIITTDNISFKYTIDKDAPQVLSGINLDVQSGEFLCIVGHNGSGKSTLAKHLNALLIPDSGTVWVDEIDTSVEETVFKVRQRVGMVFQNPDNQLVATVVEEDVAFAPENLGVEPIEIRKRVDDALNAVNMYKQRKDAPHQLSGGQKQRVSIAGIIAMRPSCIVLDEPTAMLDPAGRDKVLRTIKKLNSEYGITIILITHFMAETIMADRVLVMRDGKMVLEGTPREVFTNPEIVMDAGLKLPQPTQAAVLLRDMGFDINTDILTTDELVSAVVSLMED